MSDLASALTTARATSMLEAARRWLARDGRVAVATVVDTWGSAPVGIGGQMVISADGDFQGSVSGGCIEADVIAEAADVLEDGRHRMIDVGVADETAWSVGLPCGGRIRILVERLANGEPGARIVDDLLSAVAERRPVVVVTDLESGARSLHGEQTETPYVAAKADDDVMARLRSGKSSVFTRPDGRLEFRQAFVPPARILVVGATHIGQLVCQFAMAAGYDISVIDPRTAFASSERFPGIPLYAEWPQDVIPRLGLDPYTALVIVAHVAHIDDEALKLALRQPCLYIGALGSARNHAKRTERLTDAGFTADEIARIKCPIGLDIGAQTPAEIAISIVAEVVLAVRGKKVSRGKTLVS